METALEFWDDLEFVYKHFPEVAQAYADGEDRKGRPSLIPDGRLLVVDRTVGRVSRQDIVPRVHGEKLRWTVIQTVREGVFAPRKQVMAAFGSKNSAFRFAALAVV